MLKLRPSSSHIWVNCAAMPRLAETVDELPSSDPAREGTCAAWVAEMILVGEVSCAASLVGVSHRNGWLIEDSMAEYVQGYVDHLLSRGGRVFAEQRVYLNEMIDGTPDAFAILDETGTLYVDDLKFGYDIVEPYKNTQIAIYAGAILKKLMVYDKPKIMKVVIGVYQPRAHHHRGIYRTWEVWPEELLKFTRWIEERGHMCQDVRSVEQPGFHCEYCPAAGVCSALTNTVYKGFRVLTDENNINMDGPGLSSELEFLTLMEKLLKARKTAVETEAEVRMKNGEFIPGWGFEEAYGNRRFIVDPEVVKTLTGLDPYAEPKPCTPAELIRRGKAAKVEGIEDTVGRLSEKPRIPPKLKRLSENHFRQLFEGRLE